ncbi:MAG: major facilitator superfamily protein [Solirubrobacterales bacterium]|nr:major facilitator superfamily protein [Solirubrobacterales bacterium]
MLQPLRLRDFRLLWTGMAVSMLGDGIYFVAVAFQAYALDNDPSALAAVGLAWTGGMVVFLLLAGLVADRQPRRRVMMAADALRAVVLAVIGALSIAGVLEIWMLASLAALYGAGEAFFGPAFSALIPELVPEDQLIQANSVEHAVRPLASQVAGPAIGGLIVAAVGPGTGFVVDAATFAVSIACLAAMRVQEVPAPTPTGALREIREGLAYVRSQAWLWATLLAAALSLLVFLGPEEVLVPYVIKNDFGGGAGAFGLLLAVAGVGNAAGSFFMGRRSIPRKPVTVMYLYWGFGILPLAAYAAATATWQLMPLAFAIGFAMSSGMVIWTTLMQRRVPRELRGRVNSVDWFVSIGLTPISFALVGPLSKAFGIDATFVVAGVGASVITLGLLFVVPGLRERGDVVDEARVADGGGLHPDDLDPLAAGEAGDGADHREPVVPQRLDRPAP